MSVEQQKIIAMFDDISKSYDTANRVLSRGLDVSWRKKACRFALQALGQSELVIADVASGTGDMILHWQSASESLNVPIRKICGIDPSEGMLEIARKKLPNVEFLRAEAVALPLESASVDIISIAYGLRNVVDTHAAFVEFARVLKEGGMLVILEFTKNENPSLFGSLMGFYTRKILPKIGGLISRNMQAYQYLPDSIENFFTSQKLEDALASHGFRTLHSECAAQVSTLCVAQKIATPKDNDESK